jgi:cytochrome P450
VASKIRFIEDAQAAKSVILSPEFTTYSMADRYRALSDRTGLDFSAAIKLLDHLPVFIDGEKHQSIRKVMAKRISETNGRQLAACEEALGVLRSALFRSGAKIELVEAFCQPLWRAISSAIVPRDEGMLELVDAIPSLFSPHLSIRERAKINAKIAAFVEVHCAQSEDNLLLLCLASLGARPFVGTLGLSIWETFQAHPGAKMREMTWAPSYTSSSLTFVDRIFSAPSAQCPFPFEEGERVRCFTQSRLYSADDNGAALFGFGAHTCLGKSISKKVWALVVAALSQLDLRVDCQSIEMSPHDDPFQMPASMTIALT